MNDQRVESGGGSISWRALQSAAIAVLFLLPVPASAQGDAELSRRLDRIERDMRDLQAEIFRNAGASYRQPGAIQLRPDMSEAEMAPLAQRVGDMEQSLRRLTGQVEEMSHRLRQIDERLVRTQKEIDYRWQTNLAEPPAPPSVEQAPMADGGFNAPAELSAATPMEPAMQGFEERVTLVYPPDQTAAPAQGSLGTLAGADLNRLPQPKPGVAAPDFGAPMTAPRQREVAALGDPRAEYDTAMDLLARAQYGPAREGFRGFADAHPDHELAPQALYWSGDIAFVQKENAEAARAFAELLKKYPKSARAPEGMLKLGLALFELGQKQEGCTTLGALSAKYPEAGRTVTSRANAERKKAGC